jgi:peptidoglycan hydrolase-like protein with peptidoglycan-binding domain
MRTPGVPERQDSAATPEPRGAAVAPPRLARVLHVQQSAGNAAVASVLSRQPVEAPSRPMVRRGSRGPAVSDVQSRLNAANPRPRRRS